MTSLDDLVTLVRAPAFALSEKDGSIDGGLTGLYVDDRRVLSRCVVSVGSPTNPVGHQVPAADTATFLSSAGDLRVRRTRRMAGDGMVEVLEVMSSADAPVAATLSVVVSADLADVPTVKAGWDTSALAPVASGDSVVFTRDDVTVRVTLPGSVAREDTLTLALEIPPHDSVAVDLAVSVAAAPRAVVAPVGPPPWAVPPVPSDPRLAALVARSMQDLDVLRLSDPSSTEDQFVGAGTPWYLTLFGRDSIWTARMLLPLGTDLALGTLRALARRRGRRTDERAVEEPGKILHELRGSELRHAEGGPGGTGMVLPPVYYGTVDATPLWVCLLHDAWKAGADVSDLLPALEDTLGWVRASMDERGFLTYLGASGGLANQGWKDSPPAVQFADGRQAEGPIALCEVQAYAVEALRGGAALLDAFGRPGGDEHRAAASSIVSSFREHFWVSDDRGSFPAIALDGTGTPVDTLTSNIGHLLGTGLLSSDEESLVAGRLLELSSGYGLRTLVDDAAGYDPLSYHCGSVWTHDTAIAILGLARTGASPTALTVLAEGLLDAAEHFDWSLPELYGGQPASDGPPTPYPQSCRPQAWAAASALALLTALT